MSSSPAFLMSNSCLSGGSSGTYRFDLDIFAKSSSSSPCSYNSSTSSTLSGSSNSTSVSISTKRTRTPRKRPNQCSAEAAALLSANFPKIFSSTNIHRTTCQQKQPVDDPYPVLLSSFPITNDATLLPLESPSMGRSSVRMESKPTMVQLTTSWSSLDIQFREPGSPDFDAESILDEEVEEGIDSIMGNHSMSSNHSKESNCNHLVSHSDYLINPNLASLMAFGLGGCFGISSNTRRALKQSDDIQWWKSPPVSVEDIVPIPNIKAPPVKRKLAEKKKRRKKKAVTNEAKEKKAGTSTSSPEGDDFKAPLSLKLNYDAVLNNWSGGSPFSCEACSPGSPADVIVKFSSIDLFPEIGSGEEREASLQRYNEMRRSRRFSKKIRYEVRKTNADQRPRMKGRFVRVSLLKEAGVEESR